MSNLINASSLTLDEIEDIEKLTARWLFQAVRDFGMEAHTIFVNSPDEVQDVAEDVTRESLYRLRGHTLPDRIFGKVDYKRARYVVLPQYMLRQALFVDSKAEKDRRNATIQMAQTSMDVRQTRSGKPVKVRGALDAISSIGGREFLATTAVIHYNYEEIGSTYHLREARIISIPNGKLQNRYNPDSGNGFWLAGRNAPTLGEKFRVRVSFDRLQEYASWRVQHISYDSAAGRCSGQWSE